MPRYRRFSSYGRVDSYNDITTDTNITSYWIVFSYFIFFISDRFYEWTTAGPSTSEEYKMSVSFCFMYQRKQRLVVVPVTLNGFSNGIR